MVRRKKDKPGLPELELGRLNILSQDGEPPNWMGLEEAYTFWAVVSYLKGYTYSYGEMIPTGLVSKKHQIISDRGESCV